jgi:lantibiotic leader peptide-processing serine protease
VPRRSLALLATVTLLLGLTAPAVQAKATDSTLDAAAASALCESLFGGTFDVSSSEPLAACQWDMSLINANDATHARATGKGVRVGDIDSGVDLTHPDITPNLDVAHSCSFIFDHDPTALPVEMANGDCSNKAAVQDYSGHGTHTASTIAAPINGIGIAGVAPEATIVAIKACTHVGYCFADSVAAALRYAGDLRLDVVNLSLFADPYLYYCGSDAQQRALYQSLQAAARYAQQRGVLIIAAAGNQADDMAHPTTDVISPDWPPDAAVERVVHNDCKRAPTEIPGVLAVSATGPIGIPGYTLNIASYSDIGMGVVGAAAPGGDYFAATGTVQDAVLAAWSSTDDGTFDFYTTLSQFPGLTVTDGGARYIEINGTSMAAPHATGVAALIKQLHPGWGPAAVAAALQRTASPLACPADWQPLFDGDLRLSCQGGGGKTSFFGSGLVDAWAATH